MTEETLSRTYELGYLITPTTPEVEVPDAVAKLKSFIENLGGKILAEGETEFIDLAYTMEKNVASKKMKWSQAYFGWIKFDSAPENLESLKKSLDSNLDLIRYILVKTSVENTIVFKKPKVEAKREAFLTDEELAALEEATDEMVDEIKDDHELLPEVSDDVDADTSSKEA